MDLNMIVLTIPASPYGHVFDLLRCFPSFDLAAPFIHAEWLLGVILWAIVAGHSVEWGTVKVLLCCLQSFDP